jgi:hypothetical protein
MEGAKFGRARGEPLLSSFPWKEAKIKRMNALVLHAPTDVANLPIAIS